MSENPLMVPPRERVVEIYPADTEAELEALNAQIAEAELNNQRPRRAADKASKSALDLAAEFDALVEATRERAVKITLRAVPHRIYRQLQEKHPPRKGNKGDEDYGVNEETFFPALVRAGLVSPEVTDEQFQEFVDTCPPPAWARLTQTVHALTTNEVALPKSSAVSVLQRIRESASKPPPDSAPAPAASTDGNQSSATSTTTPAEPEPATA